jgi:hypothetical protein
MGASLLPDETEHLTTGWEPDCPPADSLVRQAVLVHASWATELAQRAGRPWHRDGEWAGGWVSDRAVFANWVVLLQPVADVAGLAERVNRLFPATVPFLVFSAWPSPDLTAAGWALVGHPPLMLRPPGAPPAGAVRASVEVREVRDGGQLALAERVLVDGYPMPELQPVHAGALFDVRVLEGPTRAWLAWDGEQPVACAVAHHAAGVTLVECVAALPAARGRGAGAAVTWAATASEPESAAVLIASDDGQPVYERLGYLRLVRWSVYAQAVPTG